MESPWKSELKWCEQYGHWWAEEVVFLPSNTLPSRSCLRCGMYEPRTVVWVMPEKDDRPKPVVTDA
jgi:hypothetical protein